MQRKGFSEERLKVAFFYWPQPAALFCRNAKNYMLLSGNKTSLTAKTSSYPFLCLVCSVGRGGWRAKALGQPPRVFCPATALQKTLQNNISLTNHFPSDSLISTYLFGFVWLKLIKKLVSITESQCNSLVHQRNTGH